MLAQICDSQDISKYFTRITGRSSFGATGGTGPAGGNSWITNGNFFLNSGGNGSKVHSENRGNSIDLN